MYLNNSGVDNPIGGCHFIKAAFSDPVVETNTFQLRRCQLDSLESMATTTATSKGKVLVLCATGKAGFNVCKALLDEGFEVHGTTRKEAQDDRCHAPQRELHYFRRD